MSEELSTTEYYEVVYDAETDRFLIHDVDHGDYVTSSLFQERRIWSHYCPHLGYPIRYSKHVKVCDS